MPASYSTAVEGGAPTALRFVIEGAMDTQGFLAFILDRANWLSLDGWARSVDNRRIELVAAGPEALVGALEMACTLGPLDTVIDHVRTIEECGPVATGFEIRR